MNDDLIARLEAASGPDRELDAAIEMALGLFPERAYQQRMGLRPKGEPMLDRLQWMIRDGFTRPLTSSIDAALTLVPEGCLWGVGSEDGSDPPWAWCLPPGKSWDDAGNSHAPTPALAICIAALRAKEAG